MTKFSNSETKVEKGWKVKDSITGFTGIVTCKLDYLNGCVRIEVTPQTNNPETGMPLDPLVFDEPQLIVLDTFDESKPKKEKPLGGPRNRFCLDTGHSRYNLNKK
jgi:hypothetical protein